MLSDVAISAIALGGASLLGSVVGFAVRKVPHKWNDIFLGFCAGMMLGAAIVCLIMEGVEMAGASGLWQVAMGVAAGVALISCIDFITPHLHRLTGIDPEGHNGVSGTSTHRILLFVTAIAIHKLPEGMATGFTFDGHDVDNAWTVTMAIALQNIPEGLVVVTPLLLIGVSRWRTVMVALAVAGIELGGVFAGYYVGRISAMLLPGMLGLAGGAMLYVLSDEMIPETHAHGFQRQATYALVAGVMAILFLQEITF